MLLNCTLVPKWIPHKQFTLQSHVNEIFSRIVQKFNKQNIDKRKDRTMIEPLKWLNDLLENQLSNQRISFQNVNAYSSSSMTQSQRSKRTKSNNRIWDERSTKRTKQSTISYLFKFCVSFFYFKFSVIRAIFNGLKFLKNTYKEQINWVKRQTH